MTEVETNFLPTYQLGANQVEAKYHSMHVPEVEHRSTTIDNGHYDVLSEDGPEEVIDYSSPGDVPSRYLNVSHT